MPSSLPSIRRRLALLVLGSILPAVLMVIAVVSYYYQRERAALAQNALETSRAMALAVDQEFKAIESGLSVLATSRSLQQDDLAGFYHQAQEVLKGQPVSNIMLASPDKKQVLNTLQPLGVPLPSAGGPQLQPIVQTQRPTVSDLFTSQLNQAPMLAVGVPVLRDGRVIYTLNAGIVPDRIQTLLMRQRLPDGWIAAIVDSSGTIIARTQAHEKYLGVRTSPNFRQRLLKMSEDAVESVSLDGKPVLTVFSRSQTTNWAVIIGIPLEILNAELRQSVQWLVAMLLVLLVIVLALTRHFSLVIIRSTRDLIAPARALGKGEPVVLPKAMFREAGELGNAIEEAALQLGRAREAQAGSEARLIQSNDALVRSNIDLQQFAFVASHDLRTPLRSIHGFVQLLEKKHGADLNPAALELIRRTTGAVAQLDQLLQALLGYARMDSTSKAFAAVDCNDVLTSALHLLDAEIVETGATIARSPLPVLQGDRTQLVQLFQNLLSNSLKYRRAGPPQIRVSAEQAAGAREWTFAVADDGIGIDPRHHETIFEVFKRLHTSQEYPGTGIGLALCARIVKRHGGRIWVDSAEGQGSTFYFTLMQQAQQYEQDPQ